jgi:tetratricopeptide (TPR) repeat protein
VEADLGNFRAAFEWFLEMNDAVSALTLILGIKTWLTILRADGREAVRWMDEALALTTPVPPGLRGCVRAWYALHTANVSGPLSALDTAREAVNELRLAEESVWLAEGLILLSEIYTRLGDFEAALGALAEARPLLGDRDDSWAIAVHDVLVAGNYGAMGRLDEAVRFARSGVDRYRSLGEPWAILEGLGLLAGIEEAQGGLETAAAVYEELVQKASTLGMVDYETLWKTRLAAIRARMGDDRCAERLFGEAVSSSRRPVATCTALIGRAGAIRRLGELEPCRQWLDQAESIAEAVEFWPGVAAALVGLAWWALASGDHDAAQQYVSRAGLQADEADDAILRLAVDTAAAAVALAGSQNDSARKRLQRLLADRAATGLARFARIGGGFVAALDEPDVVSFAAAYGLDP